MNVLVRGIGWLTKEGYGGVRRRNRQAFGAEEGADVLLKKNLFAHPFKNFGRLDPVSRMTAYGVSLALQDAEIEYGPEKKLDMGIIATNAEGCLQADIAYFKDYIAGGRILSRGNLFIYTLPSSPAGEAAIHFGLRGPLLYVAGGKNLLLEALDTASRMISGGEVPSMVAGKAEDDEAVFFVLGSDGAGTPSALCSIDEACSAVKAAGQVSELVQKFVKSKKGIV